MLCTARPAQLAEAAVMSLHQQAAFGLAILKEIRPGCSLEGLMLKLKLQYFGYLMG